MHELLEVTATRLGDDAEESAQLVIDRCLLVVEARCLSRRQLNDSTNIYIPEQQAAQQYL